MFRSRPDEPGRTSLVSSMQSFETSSFLIGLHRYPHAFSTTVFALESALKAAFDGRNRSLQELLQQAARESELVRRIPLADVDHLRTTRNRIVHRGFSPADDSLSAELFLGTAVPLLDATYRGFFGFDLYEGLLPEIAGQLRIARRAFAERERGAEVDATRFLLLMASLIRVRVQQALTSVAADATAERASEIGMAFEHVTERRAVLEGSVENPWPFDCPVCDEVEVFVGDLDGDALDERRVVIRRGYCASCGLTVLERSAALINMALAEALTNQRDAIFGEFGIAPDDV